MRKKITVKRSEYKKRVKEEIKNIKEDIDEMINDSEVVLLATNKGCIAVGDSKNLLCCLCLLIEKIMKQTDTSKEELLELLNTLDDEVEDNEEDNIKDKIKSELDKLLSELKGLLDE